MNRIMYFRFIALLIIVNISASLYYASGQGNRIISLEEKERQNQKEKENKEKRDKLAYLDAEFVDKFNLTDQELMSIQYYIEDSVLLVRAEMEEKVSRDLNNKTLSTTSTIYKKEIIIPMFTPGIAAKVERENELIDNKLKSKVTCISVDFGDDVIIQFCCGWGRSYTHSIATNYNDTPIVKVNGIAYKIRKTQHDYSNKVAVTLMADLAQLTLQKEQVEKKVAPGKTIQR